MQKNLMKPWVMNWGLLNAAFQYPQRIAEKLTGYYSYLIQFQNSHLMFGNAANSARRFNL